MSGAKAKGQLRPPGRRLPVLGSAGIRRLSGQSYRAREWHGTGPSSQDISQASEIIGPNDRSKTGGQGPQTTPWHAMSRFRAGLLTKNRGFGIPCPSLQSGGHSPQKGD
jgi:hypothetical protein